MTRKHRDEIIRWAKSPAGTNVWLKKSTADVWYDSIIPTWGDNVEYVLDDEWADIRKAFIDGETIQYYNKELGIWSDTLNRDASAFAGRRVEMYRIKPKPVYEWQCYFRRCITEPFTLTEEYFTEEEMKRHPIYRKYEDSKKERI